MSIPQRHAHALVPEKLSDIVDRCFGVCEQGAVQVPQEFRNARKRILDAEFLEEIAIFKQEGKLYA